MSKEVTKDLNWKNIDHEVYRVYNFGWGQTLRINNPMLINISKNEGHRIVNNENISYYIPYKWLYFYFETNDNISFRF